MHIQLLTLISADMTLSILKVLLSKYEQYFTGT